ncbi:MAG: adenosine deaminase [Gammaproteobacteria bacterium]|nr:adenosine deaminase [Gammaproteobacteria bacterium]
MHLPKVELHTHLEGTIPPELALKLAKRNKIQLPAERMSPDLTTYVYSDFLDFLHAYDLVADVIKHPIDYYDLTLDYLARNAKEGAIYIEMMYSPDHAEQATKIPSIEHLHAIQQAVDDAEHQFGIIGKILITAVRHFGKDAAIHVATQGLRQTVPCVVGFGLGGDEIHFPPEDFERAYAIAHDGGLACTIHAGEFQPAHTMQTAMTCLPIQRIGHGIQAIHCLETQAMLREKNITLEICPTSNLTLGLVPDIEHHPLPQLMQAGIRTCLSSDDPPFFKTNLANEYKVVQEVFQFSNDTMLTFTNNAIDAAFADEETKGKLRQKVAAFKTL